MPTKIEWATETWNPVVGCTKCSPGCQNCYAERMAKRQAGMDRDRNPYQMVVGPNGWNGEIAKQPDMIERPLHWKRPRMIFVCSMSDLFHENVPYGTLQMVLHTAMMCRQHTFLLLTKRPFDMQNQMNRYPFPPNVWAGVTVCNQEEALGKIPLLLLVKAYIRFVSIEPMLGPVNLAPWIDNLDWVIVGGESGPGARPINADWVRGVRDQCTANNTPFLFKQWGEWVPAREFSHLPNSDPGRSKIHIWSDKELSYCVDKKQAGRELDGRIWDQYPKGAT